MANYEFIVVHSSPQDRKLIHEFGGEEMKFDIKQPGRPSSRDKPMIKLFISRFTCYHGVGNFKYNFFTIRS